jgi:hypothetical protein
MIYWTNKLMYELLLEQFSMIRQLTIILKTMITVDASGRILYCFSLKSCSDYILSHYDDPTSCIEESFSENKFDIYTGLRRPKGRSLSPIISNWKRKKYNFVTMLYFSILLHCIELTLDLLCRLCATSFTILSSYFFIGHYMFRPNWPSSGVQVVTIKDIAAHCNAVFFLLL